jgi:hypothetical protein
LKAYSTRVRSLEVVCFPLWKFLKIFGGMTWTLIDLGDLLDYWWGIFFA